jgi:2-methylcitrate dehydratase PrpD
VATTLALLIGCRVIRTRVRSTDDPAWAVAQHVARTGCADLPASAVEAARRDILDTFGCMLGGSGSPGIGELFTVISRWGGAAESRVLLRGVSLPAPRAALLNAVWVMRWISTTRSTPAARSIPASGCWARLWRPATASAASPARSCCRPWRSVSTYRAASRLPASWTAAGTARRRMGVFGAAAASGKLLRLTPQQMLAAFGIAYSHAAGNRQCILDGALTKRMQAGQAASAGVFSAVLAQTGFTGARNIFGGRFGFFELYQPDGYDAAALLRDLGTAFRGEALS